MPGTPGGDPSAAPSSRLWVGSTLFTGRQGEGPRLNLAAARLDGLFPVGKSRLLVQVTAPFVHVVFPDDPRVASRTLLGNPLLGVRIRGRLAQALRGAVDASLTLPLAPEGEERSLRGLSVARATLGQRDAWLHEPGQMGLILGGQIAWWPLVQLGVSFDSRVALMARVKGDGEVLHSQFQHLLELKYRPMDSLALGLRTSAVLRPGELVDPRPGAPVQLSAGPHLAVETEGGALADVEGCLNLGGGSGTALQTGAVWGLRVRLGSRF